MDAEGSLPIRSIRSIRCHMRLSAHRKGYAGMRLERVDEPESGEAGERR
jgi:hypothetical protein